MPLTAQNPQLRTRNGLAFPTVVFTAVHWGADPPFYSIAADSTGNATYQSAPPGTENSGAPYTIDFELDACRTPIFNYVQAAHFLQGRFPITPPRPNSTIKTLLYRDAHVTNELTFESTADPNLQKLTSIFEKIAATMQFGRALTDLYRNRQAGIDSELKQLENALQEGRLREIQALTPVLGQIASDKNLENPIKQRAQKILAVKVQDCS